MKKESSIAMRDFVAKFNKLLNRILVASRPTTDNQKMFFVSSMLQDVSFQIRRAHVVNIQTTQTLVIELEDDLIATKIKKRDI